MSVYMAARALLYDRKAEHGLVTRIFQQDPKRGAVFVKTVIVPMVDYASDRLDRIAALDDLAYGNYLAQFVLPNGRISTEEFEIAGRKTELVVTIPHEGPHEWSALHALTGAISSVGASRESATDRRTPLTRTDSILGFAGVPGRLDFRLQHVRVGTYDDHSALARNTLPVLAELIRENADRERVHAAIGSGVPVDNPVQQDENFGLFELTHSGPLGNGATRGDYIFGPGGDMDRSYLLMDTVAGTTLVCLPTPWMDFGNESELQLLIGSNTSGSDASFNLAVTDPMINSVLGYINNGAVHEAAQLINFDTAERLLYNKISSPLTATLGGYLLLFSLDRKAYWEHSDDWRHWIANLSNWFEWLPDGAVLRSALHFVLRDGDRDAAYKALMTAYDRGIPFFTFGLSLMLEGMHYFANEGDTTARDRVGTLALIARAADPEQNFTTLHLFNNTVPIT